MDQRLKDFLKEKYKIWCENERELKRLLKMCDERNMYWSSGCKAGKYVPEPPVSLVATEELLGLLTYSYNKYPDTRLFSELFPECYNELNDEKAVE